MQSVGEREAGVASVSASIHTADGAIIGALSVSGPVERLTKQPAERLGAIVVATASEIPL